MRRRWFAAIVVAVAVALVVPVWGVPSNYSVPPLQDGDTLTVSCTGTQLDATIVDAQHQTLTCTGAGPTTVPTTTTAPTTTSTTTTTLAPTTTAPTGGVFTDSFASLTNWSFAHFSYEIPIHVDSRTTATVVGGAAQIAAYDQNYGDAALRSAVKYDLTNGGTVTIDMSDDAGGFPLVGFAAISFTANADDAKSSMADERPDAYSPADMPLDALQIQLRDNCRVPWAPPVVVRYRADLPYGRTVQRGNCAATPDGHWRFVFTAGRVSIRNGAGAEVVAYDVTVPPTGWVVLGVHNHASDKYGGLPSVVGLFDNITYPSG